MIQPALRTTRFKESIIREMTRHAMEHNAINLSQGFPDFGAPPELLEAAQEVIASGNNQYTVTWGYPALRNRLAELYTAALGWEVDPNIHVTVTCGVTEAICAATMAILNPGDEVIIIEPSHENFRPAVIMAGAEPVSVPLTLPDYRLDPERLAAAVTPHTRAIILNTPHNPTGRVFDAEEMGAITELVLANDLILITDEIYNRILYDGRVHVPPGSLEPLQARTITTSGFSKTFAVTGWRLGYMITPTALANATHAIHDYMTICAPTPLQAAALAGLNLPASYYAQMAVDYHARRAIMLNALRAVGFVTPTPEGAYYVLADFSGVPVAQARCEAWDFAMWMTKEVGVAVVPGSSLYSEPALGRSCVRFAFSKRLETLHAAAERIHQHIAN